MALMRVWYPRCCRNHSNKSVSRRIVTMLLRRGQTTCASFQNFSSVGGTSGSDAIAFLIRSALMTRSFSQSVPVLRRLDFDAFPVAASFMRFRSPWRDDASLLIVSIRVNYRDFETVYHSNRINSSFAILKTIIHSFNRGSVEDSQGVLEGNAVTSNIALILFVIPTKAHSSYLHNVNTWKPVKPEGAQRRLRQEQICLL